MFEALFVRPYRAHKQYGYFSTAFVRAASASEAVDAALEILRSRVQAMNSSETIDTREVVVIVQGIWRLEEEQFPSSAPEGGTLYPMSFISKISTWFRLFWLRLTKPYLIRRMQRIAVV
ncbi:MAG: hypothetical protein IPO95_07460 [Rhodanobacteraceae bacterium]|nr:hypothetical protein [Rhodanobacteraceae bacterium]